MLDAKAYQGSVRPTWCPGCGDFGILASIKEALAQSGLRPHEVLFVSGIGCGSKLPDYIHANGFTSLHGRPITIAQGAKLANHALTVIVVAGDGDTYGIGANHFLQAVRRNPDITLVVENNGVYGLTKGQYSPTSPQGFVTSTSPGGAIERALNPLVTALAAGATFVARGFSAEPRHLAGLIARAVAHKGFALVDVLQPCIVFNKVNTFDWYKQRVYVVENHDSADFDAAWRLAHEWGDRIPIGVLYQATGVPAYEEQVPALREGPLVHATPDAGDRWSALLDEFR